MSETLELDALRVAILSSASGGGAGIAANRLAQSLSSAPGYHADFITSQQLGEILPPQVSPTKSMSNRQSTDTHYTMEYPGFQRDWVINLLSGYDFINPHWTSFLISLGEYDAISRSGKPILFTFHDYHYMTGGCHYPAGCERMKTGCFGCPQVDPDLCDASFVPINLRLKKKIFSRPNVHLSAPSKFLTDEAVRTGLVPRERAHVLRNAYIPPSDPPLSKPDGPLRVLIIADSLSEQRKGMPLAVDALGLLHRKWQETPQSRPLSIEVVGKKDAELTKRLKASGLTYNLHGRITDHAKLVEIFAISDCVLTCSNEDNWPNILVESGAYGCVPVVGPGHGCEEFVRTYGFGAVTPDYTPQAFARCLSDVLQNPVPKQQLDGIVQKIRADHNPQNVAVAYREIITKVLACDQRP